MKDVLIVGASGLVGRLLFSRLGRRAEGTCFQTVDPSMHRLDVTDAQAVREMLQARSPAHVIMTAAYTNVDGCEADPARSYQVNVEAVRSVAAACQEISANCVFFSSDYVFGGENGPHKVDEPAAPLNVYGHHKVEAERIVAASCTRHLIVRTCNIYGWQPQGMNFVMACWRRGIDGEAMRVPIDQFGNPTDAEDLARAMEIALDRQLQGTLHLAGPDYVDRLTWGQRVAGALDLDPGFLQGIRTSEIGQAATRPLQGGLDAHDGYRSVGFKFASLSEGLRRFREAQQASEN